MQPPVLLLFLRGPTEEPVEELIAQAQAAITRDLVARAQASGAFAQILVVTPTDNGSWSVPLVPSLAPFHFGRQLRELVFQRRIQRPFYMGGGSLPLLSTETLGDLARRLAASQSIIISNNLHSSDLVAFTPPQALDAFEPPEEDNSLAYLLKSKAGLEPYAPPPSAETWFDVDTPTDLLILSLHRGAGPQARAFLDSLKLDLSPLQKALSFFRDDQAEVLVAGRVGSYVWSVLEKETACRVRVLAEERGLRAMGREGVGRSVLGFLLERAGPVAFFRALGELGNAAFLDTRVLLSHFRRWPSRADRFYSDLAQPKAIKDSWLREFTQAAREAPIPVVLGGHSLVSGGMLALVEAARATS